MSLAVLLSINAHKIQSARFSVSDYIRQSNRIQRALEKLEQYRLDYCALSSTGRTEAAAVYADQQLFLKRVDDNIMALREQHTEITKLLENAQRSLKSATEKNDVLTLAINRKMDRVEAVKQQRLQSECDETGRIINGNLARHKSSH